MKKSTQMLVLGVAVGAAATYFLVANPSTRIFLERVGPGTVYTNSFRAAMF